MKEKSLCCCKPLKGKHAPQCPLDEIGVDFSDLKIILAKIERDNLIHDKPRGWKKEVRISKFLKKLEKIWKKNSDLRLGQLIINVIPESALYYFGDEMLISRLKNFYKNKNKNRK